MNGSQQSEGSDSIEDVRDRLGSTRRGILKALRAVGGEGDTSTVRQTTGAEIPEGSVRYHFRWLADENLIREVDREEVSHGGRDVIVWSLTESGEQLLEAIDEERGREDRPQTIEGLNDRIDELENDLEAIKSEFNRMADLVEDHHERLEG
ncbi:hypothetical protein [Natronococcus sp. A-GB7]|uniref:hypothetical protein n=1 Tax=Natronococcus sp. A-GB7 TaxID=3037649 RepID=UPI00241D0C00|nr:hypothetical protein [Natronococcus sp. A-GB7]MDG5821626.1 hypothetical protein [Natronococcus sp. A-GB7]